MEDLFTEFVISLFLWYTIQTSLGGTATNGTCRFCHPPTVAGGIKQTGTGTPHENDEIRRASTCFISTYAVHNRDLFMLGVSTGGRISELLSLQIRSAVSYLLFEKSVVKGGEMSRAVPVNADSRHAIDELIDWHRQHYESTFNNRPPFPSRHKSGRVPMHRQTAHHILKKAFIAAGLNGRLATHSLRKFFAQRLHDKSGDIYLVQELLSHANVSTTQKYIGVNYATARQAVEGMALGAELTEWQNVKLTD